MRMVLTHNVVFRGMMIFTSIEIKSRDASAFDILLSLSEINAEKQILSAFFLAVLTGMPVFPVVQKRKPKFRFLLKLSFSSLLNP